MTDNTMVEKERKPHHALEDELTAYVQGRADDVTARRIEVRADENEMFAEKLAFEQRVADVIQDESAAQSLSADSFDALRARVEAPSFGARLREWLIPHEPRMAWAAASVAVAALAGALLFGVSMRDAATVNTFETLSTPTDIEFAPGRDYARVIFADATTAADRQSVAAELGLRIDSGPGAGSSYVVSVASDGTLADVCNDARLMFCEPLDQ